MPSNPGVTEASLREALRKIVASPGLNARLLNTLSFLEYIGARKIFKSQGQTQWTEELLSHAAEEVRHARLLKRLALRSSRGELTDYREEFLLSGRAAEQYFQEVDRLNQEVEQGSGHLSYLLTTWLIEIRALEFYRVYMEELPDTSATLALQSILREEVRHLANTKAKISSHLESNSGISLEDLRNQEERLFQQWLQALLLELNSSARMIGSPVP